MEGVSTLDPETHVAPKERIASEEDARRVIQQLQDAEKTRSRKRAKIQGMIDGNPPYNPMTLQNKGRGHQTNINLREAEGMADSAKTPYYNLVFSTEKFAKVYYEYGDNPTRTREWSASWFFRYHEMLKNWRRGMDYHFQLSQMQMVVYGTGYLLWRDTTDWRSRSTRPGQVLVPDDTPANLEDIETAATPRSMMPGELYRLIENEKSAKNQGWIVETCKQAIIQAAPESPTERRSWEWCQEQIRKGDITYNARAKKIYVVDLFQKEFNGKISHYILLDNESIPNDYNGQRPKEGSFLFKKTGRFDCFDNIFCPFFFDVGTGDWYSVKGLGPKIYDICNVSNVVTCDMVDGVRISSGVLLKASDGNALSTTQIVPVGGANVVQPGYDVVQNRIAPDMQGPLNVKRDLQLTLQSNTGQYRQRVSEENQEPTLGQAQLNVQQQQALSGGAANRYYNSLDGWHWETMRRALAMGKKLFKRYKDKLPEDDDSTLTPSERGALRFIQKCVIDDGIPLEALDMRNVCSVASTRAVGYGSPQMEAISNNELMGMMPFLSPRGRNNVLRRKASQLVGQSNVDEIVEPYDRADVPDNQVWAATQENNDLRQPGTTTKVTSGQDNFVHFTNHAMDVAMHIKQVEAGQGDPAALVVHLDNAGPHMEEHLNNMRGDPTRKDQIAQMTQAVAGMGARSQKIKNEMAKAAAAQAAANPPPPPIDPDLVKVAGELNLKKMKTEGDMNLKAQKQEQTMRLKDLQTAHNIKLKTATTTSDIVNKTVANAAAGNGEVPA